MATWPRYDPRTGFWLCEGCWNNQDWSHHCNRGILCECPKRGCAGFERPPEKVKFEGEGQRHIDDLKPGALKITAGS